MMKPFATLIDDYNLEDTLTSFLHNDRILSSSSSTSSQSLQSTISTKTYIPGIIIITLWCIYILILTILKLHPIRRFKHRFFHIQLGGSISPQAFQLNENIEQDAITITEDEDVYIKGSSYEKYKFTTLTLQMKTIRKIFLCLGLGFGIVSIPSSVCIVQYTFLFKGVIMNRAQSMEYRMDFVKETMEFLTDKKDELMNMSQDVVNSLASNNVQTCFQSSSSSTSDDGSSLVDISNDTSDAMSKLDLNDQDINEIIESVTRASELSHKIVDNMNRYLSFIWISIISVTVLNLIIILEMNGVKKAQSDKCSSRHDLIHNLIAYPLLVLLTTLLWITVAVYSFGISLNAEFCYGDEMESVLDLIIAMGFEYSVFYYFTQNYIEGCTSGQELGNSIVSLFQNLENSINNATVLQNEMSSSDSCSAFQETSNFINIFKSNFEDSISNLNATSYIINCDNVQLWYSDLAPRATCSDLPKFGSAIFTLLLVLSIITSLLIAFKIALRTDVELFLEIFSEEHVIDGQRIAPNSRLFISSRKKSPNILHDMGLVEVSNHGIVEGPYVKQKKIQLEKKYNEGLLLQGRNIKNERRQENLEQWKNDLDMIMHADECQPVPAEIYAMDGMQQQPHPQYLNVSTKNLSTRVLVKEKSNKYAPPQKKIDLHIPDEVIIRKPSGFSPRNVSPGSKSMRLQGRKGKIESVKHNGLKKSSNIKKRDEQSQQTHSQKTEDKVKGVVNRMFSRGKSPIKDMIKEEIDKQMHLQNDFKLEQFKSTDELVKKEVKKQLKNSIRLSSASTKNSASTRGSKKSRKASKEKPSFADKSKEGMGSATAGSETNNTSPFLHTNEGIMHNGNQADDSDAQNQAAGANTRKSSIVLNISSNKQNQEDLIKNANQREETQLNGHGMKSNSPGTGNRSGEKGQKGPSKQVSWNDVNTEINERGAINMSSTQVPLHQNLQDMPFEKSVELDYQGMDLYPAPPQINPHLPPLSTILNQHRRVYPQYYSTHLYHDPMIAAHSMQPGIVNNQGLYFNGQLNLPAQSNMMFNDHEYYHPSTFNAQTGIDIPPQAQYLVGEHDYTSSTYGTQTGTHDTGTTSQFTSERNGRRPRKLFSQSSATTSHGKSSHGNSSTSYSHSTRSYSTRSYSDSGSSEYSSRYDSYSDNTGSRYSHSDEGSYDSTSRSRRQFKRRGSKRNSKRNTRRYSR